MEPLSFDSPAETDVVIRFPTSPKGGGRRGVEITGLKMVKYPFEGFVHHQNLYSPLYFKEPRQGEGRRGASSIILYLMRGE